MNWSKIYKEWYLNKKYTLIFEINITRGIWMIFPTLIYFTKDAVLEKEDIHFDITLAWMCMGLTFRKYQS